LGSATVSAGVGRYGLGTPSFPLTYDRFVQNGSAQPLLSFTSPSTALADQLTGSGGGLFFNGTKANAANGGAPTQLYTPVIFQQGSSYSHLNENTFNNTGNALMTPQIDTAETLHAPGPVTLGMFEDMGWSITPQQPTAEPDLSIVAQSPNTALIPGGGITITLSVANTNTAKAEEVTVTNILPTEILTLTWESTFSQITQAGGPDFIWNLTELAVNETGVISVYGTIDPSVSMTSTILISATIATTSTETNTTNNSAALLFGGKRLYLPTIVK
jgi:hypothetical protein